MATTTGTTLHDQKNQIERQMGGCMAGFLHLFDRQHLLTGKRLPTPPPSVADSASESGKSSRSPPEEAQATSPRSKSQLERAIKTPPPPMSVFEIKEGTRTSWKFREVPRLSLDSRATTDANGSLRRKQIRTTNQCQSPCPDMEKQRKSTGVIARLMGLEPLLPSSITESPAQLRRSASESRVTREVLTHTSFDSTINYQQQKLVPTHNAAIRPKQELSARPAKFEAVRRNYYYDSADFFPEPKQTAVSVYGEIEKRLKMSGIDGSSKDLETLKHILEALQLKGLLHSNQSMDLSGQRRINEPPIVVVRPSRSLFNGTESPPPSYNRSRQGLSPRRNPNSLPSASPNRRMRNSISPTRSESSVKSTSSSATRKNQVNVETHRSRNASPEQRRVSSPVSSPKTSFRRSVDTQTSSSPRNRRSARPTEPSDESSDEHNEGKSLLSRCDMLLQSIADMNSTNTSEQPSPISVLDPSFYKEDESSSTSSSPSPVPKRSIDFKDLPVDLDEEDSSWTSSAISTVDGSSSDFIYVADVLRALACLPEESDLFPLLEKQRGTDGSNTSKLNRKLIFDNVSEILNRNKQLPPWKAISSPDLCSDSPSLPYVWSEIKKIRQRDESDQEVFQVICGVLKRDLAAESFDAQIELADSVLDIERMVFKDLIGEAIRDLASSAVLFYPRRKLAF